MRSFHNKRIFVSLSILLSVLIALSNSQFGYTAENTTDLPSQIEGINVLAMVGTNVGDNFLDVRDKLEEFNCTVTTIGRTSSVITHGGSSVSVDVQLSDFDESNDFSDYDCLFVPSGAWWLGISNDVNWTDFIKSAYDYGIFIGSMCVGSAILGPADIVEGKKILVHPNGAYLVTNAGGIYNYGVNITSDERIITGSTGSGVSGHENAPYVQFSEMVIKQILALSYLASFTVEKVDDNPGSSHKITVTTQTQHELDNTLSSGYPERNISEVEVVFYPKNSRKSSFTVELDETAENTFEGYINEDIAARYTAKIEIYTDTEELEIVTHDTTLNINTIPGFPVWTLFLLGTSIIGILVFTTWKTILRK